MSQQFLTHKTTENTKQKLGFFSPQVPGIKCTEEFIEEIAIVNTRKT